MNVEQALAIADSLIFAGTGKHLSTLQADIFQRAWLDRKYEEIAEELYCSEAHVKALGSALWDALSNALGEKITKKNFRAALERQSSSSAGTGGSRALIGHGDCPADRAIAREFARSLQNAGYETALAFDRFGEDERWSQRLETALGDCDDFFILLTGHSALSEIVTETVRQARRLRSASPAAKPRLLPVRLDDGPLLFPHDLRGYLDGFPLYSWRNAADTPSLLEKARSVAETPVFPSSSFPVSPEPFFSPDAPPLPAAEPELPEGQVELASRFYVTREPIESRCYETIAKPGALIRIKAPRQMGKTSLLSRILHRATALGYRSVSLTFQLADNPIFSDLDRLLRWFCAIISLKLGLGNRVNDFWDDIFGSKTSCRSYFEDYLLQQIETPLVLGLDEVDRVFQYPAIADDFFALLRAFHEEAKTSELWKKLRLVVVHSTEVYIPLNINQSPFNIGLPADLPELPRAAIADLALRHGLSWGTEAIDRLVDLVGGHPYLVRVALYYIARGDITLEELIRVAPTETGPYSDHLRRHLFILQQQTELATAFEAIVTADRPVRLESIALFKLYSTGLIRIEENQAFPRCRLYRRYFGDRLVGLGR